ncbi:class D beta-lactamase [Picosynechococcus sp. PCC 7003]|nr:class D beta-lactamase [Picosynechococcus sp. PCC 7003]
MNFVRGLGRLVATLSCLGVLLIPMETPERSKAIADPGPAIARAKTIDFQKHFQDLGLEGSILIYDLQTGRSFQHNPQRNQTAFPVASTFKIPNSLIALETGVIPNELALLTWDGISRELPVWNRDLNLKEAFKHSAVWFYQVLARRTGHDRMKQWIEAIAYGNQAIGTPDNIDQFWLNGTLQITPQGQVDFLRRLYANELPFSAKAIATVKEIMIAEQTPNYTIRAKTGWFGFGNPQVQNIGWYVGYVERGDDVYFFATNIDINSPQDGSARLEVTRRCLQELGILP